MAASKLPQAFIDAMCGRLPEVCEVPKLVLVTNEPEKETKKRYEPSRLLVEAVDAKLFAERNGIVGNIQMDETTGAWCWSTKGFNKK